MNIFEKQKMKVQCPNWQIEITAYVCFQVQAKITLNAPNRAKILGQIIDKKCQTSVGFSNEAVQFLWPFRHLGVQNIRASNSNRWYAKFSNPEISTPFSLLRRYWYQKIPNFWVHLLVYMKILSGDAHLPKHPRKCLKSVFSMSSSKETGPSLLSFQMIFEILQSELFRFKIHSVRSKILKIPEFNLKMIKIIYWGPNRNLFLSTHPSKF